jgi:AraC-like DNA-binding protein
MSTPVSTDDEYFKIFRDMLLVWSRQGAIQTALASPPFVLPLGIRMTSTTAPPLKVPRRRRSSGRLTAWPHVGLHAKPNPFLVFVLEGPVDLGVGVTQQMLDEADEKSTHGIYHLRLPRQSLLVYPAHVPTSDGIKPHWNEPSASLPDSYILWVDITLEGAILHTCRTRGGSHTASQSAFVFDVHLPSLIDSIIEELKAAPDGELSMELTQSLLQVLLLRLTRALKRREQHRVSPDFLLGIAPTAEPTLHSPAVRRACNFIEGHLGQPLLVEKIAGQAFVSPAQLNRLFRAELGQSVMQYVSEQRLQRAKSLLENTTLPVGIISDNLGLRNAVYFSRLFRKSTGMTPLEYRRKQR